MGRTLFVYMGNIIKPGAPGLKRVMQFARGLALVGDRPCLVGLGRGTGEDPTWHAGSEGFETRVLFVPPGSNKSFPVVRSLMTLPRRLADAVVDAATTRGCTRVFLYGPTWAGMRPLLKQTSRLNLPTVVDMNEWFPWEPSRSAAFLDEWLFRRRCLPKISGIVGISSFWKSYAKQIGKPCVSIPAMSDDPPAPPAAASSREVFHLVYVGVLFRRDLPDTLLDGVRLALERGCRMKMTVVGRTELWPESRRSVARVMADPMLRAAVEITGWVEAERLREIYESANAFVLLRRDEWTARVCFPTRLPEYMNTGRPVITSAVGDVTGLLKHAEDSWLLPAGDCPDKLADAICQLAADSGRATQIGRSGFDAAKRLFSYALHANRLNEFINSMEQRC